MAVENFYEYANDKVYKVIPMIFFEDLEKEIKEVKICKVNVDEEPELAEKYNVASIPTFLLIKEKIKKQISKWQH